MRGFENSVRSAEKGRALGLGVLDGILTYKEKVFRLKDYLLNLKLVKSFLKSRLNQKEQVEIWQPS